MLSVLEVTQRVQPTCIIKTDVLPYQCLPHRSNGGQAHLKINNVKSVSIDRTRRCIHTSNKNKNNTRSYTFNRQSDPSLYFDNMIGTGSYTTSTTNMYKKDRFHVPGKSNIGNKGEHGS